MTNDLATDEIRETADSPASPAAQPQPEAEKTPDRPRTEAGDADRLGATWDGAGTNFSVYSSVATAVDLCLFDASGRETRVPMPERTRYCWTVKLPGIGPGQRYGFRVHGPWDPSHGHRCNPNKLLLDPYARAIAGPSAPHASWYPYPLGGDDNVMDATDSGPFTPRAVVVDPRFDWGDDRRPGCPMEESIIYELHVKGFTKKHPKIPEALRGSYAGLGHPAAVEYLVSLGITAVELLPVHQFTHDSALVEHGLANFWGYNSIGFFAPHGAYSSTGDEGGQVQEFKTMVRALHAAGLEVILDVVFNHTAEGNQLGPSIAFKGLDNATYYRLSPEDARFYQDFTGTGNSLNAHHPQVVQLIVDSLRYWVLDMHVDGFRFDLATTLGRVSPDFDRYAGFFDVVHQDPVLSRVKLIAEPWDVGPGGYQVGNFPIRWSEWNGKYRDIVRDFWRGEDRTMAEFASRLTGSADMYQADGRSPSASVNFVTSHDGFTLSDLVSYNDKHNEANGEENRDGDSQNRSWNCGAEGPTDDPAVLALRARQQRNFLATLLVSHGVPMIVAGDERGRTQRGNNNAYCQDNDLSWLDWTSLDEPLLAFARRLIALRRERPEFRRGRWDAADAPQIGWFRPDGEPMTEGDWKEGWAKSFAMLLASGREGLHLLLLFNAHHEPVGFTMPASLAHQRVAILVDTGPQAEGETPSVQASFVLKAKASFPLARAKGRGAGRSAVPVADGPTPNPAAKGRSKAPVEIRAPFPLEMASSFPMDVQGTLRLDVNGRSVVVLEVEPARNGA